MDLPSTSPLTFFLLERRGRTSGVRIPFGVTRFGKTRDYGFVTNEGDAQRLRPPVVPS